MKIFTKQRVLAVLKWGGLAMVTLGLLYALAYVVLAVSSGRKLRQAMDELSKAKRPMTAYEIIPAPAADPDNASLLYRIAVLRLKTERDGDKDLFDRLNDIGSDLLSGKAMPEQAATFRALAGKPVFAQALALWEDGLAKPRCRYDLKYDDGPGILMPHLSDHRNLTKIFCATALAKAQDGDADGAWRLIEENLRFADALKDEPILISQLVRIAQFTLTEKTMRQVAAIAPPPEARLASLDQALRSFTDRQPFVTAMDGERLILGEWVFNLPSTKRANIGEVIATTCGSPGPSLFAVTAYLVVLYPFWNYDHAAYLNIMGEYARTATLPYAPEDQGRGEQMLSQIPRYCIMTRMIVPALSSCKTRFIELVARVEVARASLAALQYQQKNGPYPETLAATGATFTDPFTGQALIYRRDAAGFTVYSVGKDLVDEGGVEVGEGKIDPKTNVKTKTGDLVWNYRTAKP